MNLLPGTQTRTTDGVIGVAGTPLRIFWVHVISAASDSVLAAHNGTSASGTQVLSLTGTSGTGKTFNFAGGVRFPNGCFLDVDANLTSVTVSYTQEQ